jgi:hypothetical protein
VGEDGTPMVAWLIRAGSNGGFGQAFAPEGGVCLAGGRANFPSTKPWSIETWPRLSKSEISAVSGTDLLAAIRSALGRETAQDVVNWFTACGYSYV